MHKFNKAHIFDRAKFIFARFKNAYSLVLVVEVFQKKYFLQGCSSEKDFQACFVLKSGKMC